LREAEKGDGRAEERSEIGIEVKTHVLVEADEGAATVVVGGATNSGSSMVALLQR